MKLNTFLVAIAVSLALFSTMANAANEGNVYTGGGKFFAGGFTHSNHSSKGSKAVVTTLSANGEKATHTYGGDYDNPRDAIKAANKMAKKMARKAAKVDRQIARALNKKERVSFWNRLKNLFKKKEDSVMAGPNGEGDYRGGGGIIFDKSSGSEIVIPL